MSFLVHDLGTSADKAALYDDKGRLIASVTADYPTEDLGNGGYQQNPADWLQAVCHSTRKLAAKAPGEVKDIDGISLSGHMMGVVALDDKNLPVRPAILHSDIRSRPQVRQIAERISPHRVHQICGSPLDVHYPMPKILWLRDNEPDSYRQSRVFVQSKDYVASWLTGVRPVTDYSDASLYGCFDIHQMDWSAELLEVSQIDRSRLPEVTGAGSLLGKLCSEAAREMGLQQGIPVYMGFGDGASAALGSGSWKVGSCYNYVGTTSWVAATTPGPVIDPEGRLFSIALTKDRFSILGTVQSAGAAWDWVVTRFCQAQFGAAEAQAESSKAGCGGLFFLPYLSGERAPVWNENARGVWFGLASHHSTGDLLRSVLEGVSLALASVYRELCRCSGQAPEFVRLIGGGAKSELWRGMLAACYGREVRWPGEVGEATARGALKAAALGAGVLKSFDDDSHFASPEQSCQPDASLAAAYEAMKPLFGNLYGRLEGSFDELAALRDELASLEKG